MMKRILFFSGLFICCFSCEKMLMNPMPKTTPLAIYDEYWKIVSEKFAMFDDPVKNIDKENLHKTTRAKITENMSEDDLFQVLGEITVALKDKHSFIKNIQKDVYISYDDGISANSDIGVIKSIYLTNSKGVGKNKQNEPALRYKTLTGNIGYMKINSWEDIELETEMIDNVLTDLKDTKGIIIDVRGNGGGQPDIATMVTKHFTTKKIFAGTEWMKSGPGKNDFEKSKLYINPEGVKYTKPVVILTDIISYSATTLFISYFRAIRHATDNKIAFIGSKTGGGTGNATHGYLANGWVWSVSGVEFREFDGGRYDNGVEPDIKIWDDTKTTDRDEVIERAIQKINSW